MNKFESALGLTELRVALTIVIGNDIIVPFIDQREDIFRNTKIYGYIWRYKNCDVKVDLNDIVRTNILESNELDKYIEDTRAYVKSELLKLISREVKNNAM